MTTSQARASGLRSRPIVGGPFGGDGRFVMATLPCIEKGLHAVRHMVLEPSTGAVLATSLDKRQALADARRLLRTAKTLAGMSAANDQLYEQAGLWPDADLPRPEPGARAKPVPRRRREIFELSGGKCAYCGTVLRLDGTWHADHCKPRALGGTNDIMNMRASCPACNLAKRDRTSLEFIVSRTEA